MTDRSVVPIDPFEAQWGEYTIAPTPNTSTST